MYLALAVKNGKQQKKQKLTLVSIKLTKHVSYGSGWGVVRKLEGPGNVLNLEIAQLVCYIYNSAHLLVI